MEAPLPHQPRRPDQPGEHQPHDDDHHARELGQPGLVGPQGLAEGAGPRLEAREHHGEAGHEQQRGPQHRALVGPWYRTCISVALRPDMSDR